MSGGEPGGGVASDSDSQSEESSRLESTYSIVLTLRGFSIILHVVGFAFLTSWLVGDRAESVWHHAYACCVTGIMSAFVARCMCCQASAVEEMMGVFNILRFGFLVYGTITAINPYTDEHDLGAALNSVSPACCIVINAPILLAMYDDEISLDSPLPVPDSVMHFISMTAAAARLLASGFSCWKADHVIPPVLMSTFSVMMACAVRDGVKKYQCRLRRALQKSSEKQALVEQAQGELRKSNSLLSEERACFSNVLSAICECSFKMSDELCVTHPTPQLHDVLGCKGSVSDIFGKSIGGFMSKQDAQRLQESVARTRRAGASHAAHSAASKLPLELVTASRAIEVEFYHALLNQEEHIVVICKPQGVVENEPAASSPSAASPLEDTEAVESMAEALAWIEFDAAHPSLRMYDGSEEFRGHQNSFLLDWIRSDRRGRVLNWVRTASDILENAKDGEKVHTEKLLYFELNLNLATVVARKAWLEFFPSGSGRGGEGVERPVRLCMEDLTVRWKPVVDEERAAIDHCAGDAESDIGANDSFSQVGHLFFVSNRP